MCTSQFYFSCFYHTFSGNHLLSPLWHSFHYTDFALLHYRGRRAVLWNFNQFQRSHSHKTPNKSWKNYFRLLLNSEKTPDEHWVIYFALSAWRAIWTYGSIWFINIQQDTSKLAAYAILNSKHRRKQFTQYN